MPRPRSPYETKRLTVRIPTHLYNQLERILWDSAHEKPKYGAMSQLVTGLLQRVLADYEKRQKDSQENVENG